MPKLTKWEYEANGSATELSESFWIGLVPFLIVFSFWMSFSSSCITFYRDDNVIATGPLLIEAARQVKEGNIPWQTYFVGGGGGTPLITIMQAGVLCPLKLIPAMIFGHRPEAMMNLIISLHLALGALGAWYLAAGLRAPAWAAMVAAFSLGFCGALSVGAGNWEGVYIPFTYVPWLLGGLVRLSRAPTIWEGFSAHIVTAWSWWSMFYAGPPIAGFYGIILVFWCSIYLVLTAPGHGKWLFKHLLVQFVLFAALVGPLLWEARKVYAYYGRENPPHHWQIFSVPVPAYLGVLVPFSHSLWLHVTGKTYTFTNLLLFCGGVPAWLTLAFLVRQPAVFVRSRSIVLLVGTVLFVPLLSPAALGLERLFSETPVLRLFRWPFRGLGAFHILIIFLFLVLASKANFARRRHVEMALVAACIVLSLVGVFYEYRLALPARRGERVDVVSWFVTNHFYDDPQGWDQATLKKLRTGGYVMNLCTREPPFAYWQKPKLFFTGNLGAQLLVPTVYRYIFAAQSDAYRQIGMEFSGLIHHWPAAKRFIESSAKSPLPGHQEWENGIGPRDFRELAEKTYVSAIIVESSDVLREPITYFLNSTEWELVANRPPALLFLRRRP